MTEIIREKISLLYDFCILTRCNRKHDPNESRIRALLKSYTNENDIERVIHGLLMGHETLEQLLVRKGY